MQERTAEKEAEKTAKAAKPQYTAEQLGGSQAAADAANSTASELEEQYGILNKGGFVSKRTKKKKK